VLRNLHEMPFGMALPLLVLCLGSMFSGFLTKDIFLGEGSGFLEGVVHIKPPNTCYINLESDPA